MIARHGETKIPIVETGGEFQLVLTFFIGELVAVIRKGLKTDPGLQLIARGHPREKKIIDSSGRFVF